MKKNQKGFGIIEVVVALGVASLIIISIGKVLNSVHKLYTASEFKTRALSYAQEPLEIITDIKNDSFACQCAVDSCVASVCSRISDGQSCNLLSAYTSCWTNYPLGYVGQTSFHLVQAGSVWQLISGPENPMATDSMFSRTIIIENVLRDINGDIADTGTADPNAKKIIVTVNWTERGETKTVSLSTILTAWENL